MNASCCSAQSDAVACFHGSALMLASLITLPQRALSTLIMAANSSGVLPTGTKPIASRRSLTSGRANDPARHCSATFDDRARRRCGRKHAEQSIGLLAGKLGLADRRHAGP